MNAETGHLNIEIEKRPRIDEENLEPLGYQIQAGPTLTRTPYEAGESAFPGSCAS
jgi:hypothetical protein